MVNEIDMEKNFNNMILTIKNHYFNTELGKREIALNLATTHINLTSDFPYYDLGIRALGIEEYFDIDNFIDSEIYKFYVDFKFLFTSFYKDYCDSSDNYMLSSVIIISNEDNIRDETISIGSKLLFDMEFKGSNMKLCLDKYVLTTDSIFQLEKLGFITYLDMTKNRYMIYVDAKNQPISEIINKLNLLFKDLNKILDLVLIVRGLNYEESLNYLNVLLDKMDENKYLKIGLVVYKNLDRKSFKEFRELLSKCEDNLLF